MEIISFQDLFISSKYHKFWLSYECSDLCDILLPKPASSGLKQVCGTVSSQCNYYSEVASCELSARAQKQSIVGVHQP